MKRLFQRSDRKERTGGACDESRVIQHKQEDVTSSTPFSRATTFVAAETEPRTNGRSGTESVIHITLPDPSRKSYEVPSPVTDVLKKDYWQLAIDSLEKVDPSIADKISGIRDAAAENGETDFAEQLLHATRNNQRALEAKRWKIIKGNREIVVRDQLNRLLNGVMAFKNVMIPVSNIDPVHVGLPLAGFCVLLQTFVNDFEEYATIVAGVEELVTIMARYQQIEVLYASRPGTTLKHEFERLLVSMYKHIICYQISAAGYYQRNTMLRFWRSIPRLDDLSTVLATIRQEDNACKSIGQVFDSTDAVKRHEELRIMIDRLLKQGINQEDQSFVTQPCNVHWMIYRPTNTLFTGREEILLELEATVRDAIQTPSRSDTCNIVISGMGAQGKSEICLQLARRVRKIFWGVFWVDVSTPASAEADFLNIASRLGLPAQSMGEARQGLANVNHPWLLVLDNADDPEVDYQCYFPVSSSGVVMMTSRNAECHQYTNTRPIELEGLPDKDALDLLLRAAKVVPEQTDLLEPDARRVCGLLGSHPLALIQAGTYISHGHCSLADYPRVFDHQRKRLLKYHPRQAQSRYRDVYATFEASADLLQAQQTEAAEDALELLPILGIFAASRLPLPLFEAGWKGARDILGSNSEYNDYLEKMSRWHISHLPPFVQADSAEWDSFRLLEAVSLLKAFSLVSTNTYHGFMSVSMHPLTNVWAQDRLDATAQDSAWLIAGCLVGLSFYDGDIWQRQRRQLRPHLEALVSRDLRGIFTSKPPRKITCILLACGWELHNGMKDDVKLSGLMSSLMKYLNLDRSVVDPSWLPVCSLNASNLRRRGKFPEAVSLLEQVDQIKEQAQNNEDEDRLYSQIQLAMAYDTNGQTKEAISLMERVVKNGEKMHAEINPGLLMAQHNLACFYLENKQTKEGVSLLREIVQISKELLHRYHPSLLCSQHMLAKGCLANGQSQEAVSLLENVVEAEEQILDETHADLLASQHDLARAYGASGQIKEAISLLEKVVRIEERTLREDHPDRLESQDALAILYNDNAQFEKALHIHKEVLRIRERVLAEDHPDRLRSQRELASTYQANGRIEDALYLQEKVVEIQRRVLPAYHLDMLTSESNLATIYWDLGRRDAAIQMMKRVVEMRRKVLDEGHPDRMKSEGWLKD